MVSQSLESRSPADAEAAVTGGPTRGRRPARAVPTGTYRVQLRPDAGFEEIAELADYLAALGVSHLYASPSLQAAPGSLHGYDVVDPTRPSADLGADEGHERLAERLRAEGLGILLDIVPNHMAIGVRENRWWWDVLENGPSSVFASYFDVEWDPAGGVANRVLLPVLPDRYGRVLESGGLRLARDGAHFTVVGDGLAFPLSPTSVAGLLRHAAASLGPASAAGSELTALASGLASLPPSWVTDAASVRARDRDKERLRSQLAELLSRRPEAAEALDRVLEATSGDPDALDQLLEQQNYRLADWRSGGREMEYRRFFDVDSLIGLRVEDEMVFADSHALVLEWYASGRIDGFRVDHVDGLADPGDYLNRLAQAADGSWIVVEKILTEGEQLPESWPVAGTTGYEVAAALTRVLVDPAGEEPLEQLWREVSGDARPFAAVAHEAKHEVLSGSLAADLAQVTAVAVQVARAHRHWRDASHAELRRALAELCCSFSVYRTYVPPAGRASEIDRARLASAAAEALRRRGDLDRELVTRLLVPALAGDPPFVGPAEQALRRRFQQLTGPVMAKGVEDRAFYRYLRLVALNEVGADPGRFAMSPEELHGLYRLLGAHHPYQLAAASTHDTKRSEDVRARLVVLAEVPTAWAEAVGHFRAALRGAWGPVEPDPRAEYLLAQTLVGAWPIGQDRLVAYLQKATREAALRTTWTDPDPAYEDALERVVQWATASAASALGELAREVLIPAGRLNSLVMKGLQLAGPIVPDTYQGTECWDLSLVDPDNRRPVDWGLRRDLLAVAEPGGAAGWWARESEGLPKLGLTRVLLQLRRSRPDLFGPETPFEPLEVTGPASDHLVGFRRGEELVVFGVRQPVALGRRGGGGTLGLLGRLAAAAEGTSVRLPAGRFLSPLTGQEFSGQVDLREALAALPVAVLVRSS